MKKNNHRISNSEKLALYSNLATMLQAGIPILEAVRLLAEESHGSLKKMLEAIAADLVQGEDLSTSFSRFPAAFDRITINILKASERSGTLETTLKDLRNNLRRDIEFTDKVKSSLLYPAILLVVFSLVFIVILTFVIPRIAMVFKNLKVVLPLPTKILIFVSQIFTTYTLPIVALLIVLVLAFVYFYETRRKSFFKVFSHLPVVSLLVREIDLTRFSRSLALLLGSNVPIASALELSQDVVVGRDLNQAILRSRDIILSGGRLSEGLRTPRKTIPAVITKIIESGEKSGSLDKSMQDVSEYLDYNVTNDLKMVTTLLEPLILVVVGLFVGGMMLSIIAPIYNLIGQISAH
ncbi:type II secretion system F family protein [Patescibacteria group bacterium]|nr:type II secretion system F family protein [Patescibacteria group bacterium]